MASESGSAEGGPRRVLVVEDDLSILTGVSMNLRFEGYEVLQAQDGRTGLQKALDERPHLILLDVMLPDMSGYEIVERLRADPGLSGVRILLMTARGSIVEKRRGMALGADTITAQLPVVAMIFGQAGLMAGASIEGTKYTRIIPSEIPTLGFGGMGLPQMGRG